jgi:hypothetical protein
MLIRAGLEAPLHNPAPLHHRRGFAVRFWETLARGGGFLCRRTVRQCDHSGMRWFLSGLSEIFSSANSAVKSVVLAALLLSMPLFAQSDARIPPEVRYKSGYIDPVPRPPDFISAMLWGIAIADTRVPGYRDATVEIAQTQLICRADGHDFVLNDDRGAVRGGLYRRYPWFGTDVHEPIPLDYSDDHRVTVLRVGTRPERVWHFWAASPRPSLPSGHLEGCMVKTRVRISEGALLQMGFDYWRNTTVGYGSGGNNHEAGASDWYFPSPEWQEAIFSDIKR